MPALASVAGTRTRGFVVAASEQQQPRSGKLRRIVLSNGGRSKLDSSPDSQFYAFPRFVTHVDDQFIATLTKLYKSRIPPGSEVLDLMSSWVSHLPKDVPYKRVVGHGLNAQELARNQILDYFIVKDLNKDTRFEFADQSFDAVVCAVSVQYLQQPEEVFSEIYRLLRPGGACIVSFSNRMFYDKAVSAWRDGNAYSRVQLVVQYFQCVAGFTKPEIVQGSSGANDGDAASSVLSRLLGALQRKDPFYAVISYRNFKPID